MKDDTAMGRGMSSVILKYRLTGIMLSSILWWARIIKIQTSYVEYQLTSAQDGSITSNDLRFRVSRV